MVVTNKLKLPQAFVKAVSTEKHNKEGEFSATTLLKGCKEIILTDRHWDEIEVDAADRVWQIFGSAVHKILEEFDDGNFHEEKFRFELSKSVITGTIDSYDMDNGVVYDWKTASIWKTKFKDFSDWKRQGLTYAWLLKRNGFTVNQCRFVALLKDHSKSMAAKDPEYPISPCIVYEFDVTDEDLQAMEKEITEKIPLLEEYYKLPDDEIPPCTKEERWADDDKYAVMKKGQKKAVKVCDSEEEANTLAEESGPNFYVEHRPAVSRKCQGYCDCKQFCNFYKNMIKGDE